MRRYMPLLLPLLGSCSLLLGRLSSTSCNQEEARCDGSVLVLCEQGIEVSIDCHEADRCNAEVSACGRCGDGITNPDLGEQCDDGDDDDKNACTNGCLNNPQLLCGDGAINRGDERCDDGNNIDGDGCQSDCTHCGDGVTNTNSGEQCDDGNRTDEDGCNASCGLEGCGNGSVQESEGCDDGNTDDSDGCPSNCQPATCGDGFLLSPAFGNEPCDDGNLIEGDGCDSSCNLEFSCGDGVVNPGDLCFLPEQRLAVGFNPSSPVVVDLNNDGAQDLIIPDQDFAQQLPAGVVSILLGDGLGSFSAAPEVSVGLRPSAAVVRDFSGDGFPDLATVNADSDTISVRLGNGDGTFQSESTYEAGNLPFRLFCADFDGDAVLDLVVGYASFGPPPTFLSLLRGNSDGTFQPRSIINVGVPMNNITLGDLNSDGLADLLATNNDSQGNFFLQLLINTGGALFFLQQPIALPPNSNVFGIGAGNVTGDGAPDLFYTDPGQNLVGIFIGAGGSFTEFKSFLTAGGPFAITSGDFSNDGRADLLVVNLGATGVSINVDRGDEFRAGLVLPVGEGAFGLTTADLNNDGALDIITANQNTNDLSLILSNP